MACGFSSCARTFSLSNAPDLRFEVELGIVVDRFLSVLTVELVQSIDIELSAMSFRDLHQSLKSIRVSVVIVPIVREIVSSSC